MTNWPNIQEYRNFEAKFVDNPKLKNSPTESEFETVVRDEYKSKDDSEDFANVQRLQASESKTVRCVIKKDFEETFKKFDRGDGFLVSHESVRPKTQEMPTIGQPAADKIRLENHLKWKKQKEEEYLQKKEAERLAQQKKREEELRLERAKKQREKEREEKIREWQEQKAREKEEKKREKMVMKVLEDELKVVTPTVNKDKLIEEWVKLKNKQKQIESEKKAELLKKEEESRALRQSLAEISYRQWKERVKGRMMSLPKNGYQIFGPKPAPVVKEDWNHDFTSNDPRDGSVGLRGTKSTTSTSLTFRAGPRDMEDLPKDIFYIGDSLFKNRSPSFYHLKTAKSGLALCEGSESISRRGPEMPLKELQPTTVDLKNTWTKEMKLSYGGKSEDFTPQDLRKKTKINSKTPSVERSLDRTQNLNDYLTDLGYFPSAEGDQNRCAFTGASRKLPGWMNGVSESQVLPNKKKIDLYINNCPDNCEESYPVKQKKKSINKTNDVGVCKKEKKENANKRTVEVRKIVSREGSCAQTHKKPSTALRRGTKSVDKSLAVTTKPAEPKTATEKATRRSRSYDKPVKKLPLDKHKVKGCSSSRSTSGVQEDASRSLRLAKSKISCGQKRRSRKQSKPSSPPQTPKIENPSEPESKARKKLKKKNVLSKSFSFIESPYCVKSGKSLGKAKPGRRKSAKEREAKSDATAHCRKSSTTKI